MRWFITFKKNTSHYDKVLVIQSVSRHIAWDIAVKHYADLVDAIYSEQDFSVLMPQRYECKDIWIEFGTEVSETEDLQVSVKSITDWFKIAKPEPVMGFPAKWLPTQLGAHFEEVAEMISAMYGDSMPDIAIEAYNAVSTLSDHLYSKSEITINDDVGMLDALADQVVTATGVAYFSKFKFDEALTEVNKSNYSKFEQGKPVLNEHQKIIKGKDYFKPDLTKFV